METDSGESTKRCHLLAYLPTRPPCTGACTDQPKPLVPQAHHGMIYRCPLFWGALTPPMTSYHSVQKGTVLPETPLYCPFCRKVISYLPCPDATIGCARRTHLGNMSRKRSGKCPHLTHSHLSHPGPNPCKNVPGRIPSFTGIRVAPPPM